jgi:hypothetical protein
MNRRLFATLLALAVLIAVASTPAAAQSTYKAPRTPDGVPDLQGIYLTTSSVPLQRAQNLGAKEFYTEEELADRAQAAANRPPAEVGVHYDNSQFGLTSAATGTVPFNRTSIITGPTGRVPPLIAAAVERQRTRQEATRGHQFDGPENRGIAERCIYWGHEGPPLRPVGYNGMVQIVQGPGYVALMHEMIHTVHIIPTDGRAHVDPKIRQWHGNPVGHWEGETLVVESTNFNDLPPVGNGASQNVRVVERFTRTGPDTVMYQFTVSDPSTWEQSWSGELPLGRTKGPIFEYACQEGNYGMGNILSGARAAEKEAAAKQE